MLMKPAWPRLSSPEKPITRFRETAMIIHAQIGTSRPFRDRLIALAAIMFWRMMNAAITRPNVTRL